MNAVRLLSARSVFLVSFKKDSPRPLCTHLPSMIPFLTCLEYNCHSSVHDGVALAVSNKMQKTKTNNESLFKLLRYEGFGLADVTHTDGLVFHYIFMY